jgi:hypothetical protein
MASSQKISELTTAGPLTGTELVPIVQNGGTLQTTVSLVAAFAVVSLTPVVSALATQITQVSSAVSAVNVRVDTVSAAVSSLDVRLTQVSSVGTANTAAIVSTNNVISALEVRVSAVSATGVANTSQIATVSALTSVNAVAITSVNAAISALDTRVSVLESAVSAIGDVSAIAGLVSTVGILEADVSALTIRVAAVSAATSVNADAITSTNAVVSVNAETLASVASIVSTESLRLDAVSAAISVNSATITSVNAVVSTKVNRSGDFLENVRYINFDTSVNTVPTTVGQVAWNSEDGTVEVGLYSNVMLKTGQNTYFYVKNENSITIPKGRLVMAVGTLGVSGKITAELAIADGTVSPEYFLGVAANNIAVGDFGYVTAFGLVQGFDTTGAQYAETWADGDLLYPRPAGVGGLTNVPPAFPGFSVPVAIVILAAGASTGSIFVRMKSGEYLSQLHDVDLSAVASNDILVYNTSLSAWTNSPLLVQTQASVSALNIQVADVSALTSVNAAAITSLNAMVSTILALLSVTNFRIIED